MKVNLSSKLNICAFELDIHDSLNLVSSQKYAFSLTLTNAYYPVFPSQEIDSVYLIVFLYIRFLVFLIH